jgi:ADP-heptose:LPS heptosyltransferase
VALSSPTVLVLRALGLGDLLTAVPALRGIRRALPRHRVVLATPASLAPLALLSGAVDQVIDTCGLEPLAGRCASPAVAVDLHGRGPQSHRVLQAVRPGRLVAFGCAEAGVAGPPWREREREVARWCRLVRDGLGGDPDEEELRLPVPGTGPPLEGAVVVHPGAAFPSRRWPPEHFAAVARALAGDGERVVVTGTPEEVPLARRVAGTAGLTSDAVLAGRTDIQEMAALVAVARLVVCGDTGTAHLASAFGTPSVVLFGPVSPTAWGPPPGRPQHVVLEEGAGYGDPWGDRPDPALRRITVPRVVEAARALLDASPRSVPLALARTAAARLGNRGEAVEALVVAPGEQPVGDPVVNDEARSGRRRLDDGDQRPLPSRLECDLDQCLPERPAPRPESQATPRLAVQHLGPVVDQCRPQADGVVKAGADARPAAFDGAEPGCPHHPGGIEPAVGEDRPHVVRTGVDEPADDCHAALHTRRTRRHST